MSFDAQGVDEPRRRVQALFPHRRSLKMKRASEGHSRGPLKRDDLT